MALRWIDGFETYGVTSGNTSTGPNGKYTTGSSSDSSFTIKSGRLSGDISLQFGGGAFLNTPTFGNDATWTVGFGYKQDQYTNEQEIFQWRDSTSVQCSLTVTQFGELKVYRGSSFSLLGTTSGAGIQAGVWFHVEVKITFNGSTGTVDIHVNGNSVLALTGKNTANSGNNRANNFRMEGNLNSTDHGYFDDLYILDSTGSNNTTFLGPLKVTAVLPSSDGGTLQWTPNSGSTHYSRVNDNPPDKNTSYLSDSTSGDVDIWNKLATAASIASIRGIQQNTMFETDSASAFSVIQRLVSGATTSDDGGTAGTNGTYTQAARVLETDPNTGSLWTQSNLDSATIGIKVA
jgi:hypothetical protein